jgi:Ca-activated chloride channel homolog
MRRVARWWTVGVAAAIIGCWGIAAAEEPRGSPDASAKKTAKKAPISSASPVLRQANGSTTQRHRSVTPIHFTSKEGKRGWRVTIPGGQPLATPAVAEGKVFVGGGLASRDFFALDAETGKTRWHYGTADVGPTSPSVYSGYVTFSTESCELEVLTTNGDPVWKKWLGWPLISQPAVADGRVLASFPVTEAGGSQQYLASFELKTGKEQWRQKIAAEVIAAPVIENRHVLVATVDGALCCFRADDGKAVWIATGVNATSAPTVWSDRCWFGRWQESAASELSEVAAGKTEQMASRRMSAGGALSGLESTNHPADYLGSATIAAWPRRSSVASGQNGPSASADLSEATAPSAVAAPLKPWAFHGLATTPPSFADAMRKANLNLGASEIGGLWVYQGSRPLFYEGRLYAAMGDSVTCIDIKTEKILWSKSFRPAKGTQTAQSTPTAKEPWQRHPTVTPPVLVNGKVFFGTSYGEVVCLLAASGETLWKATIGHPIVAQPAVEGGRIYLPTKPGILYCLETGDPKDDGWPMWGGDAKHSGRADETRWKQACGKRPSLAAGTALQD